MWYKSDFYLGVRSFNCIISHPFIVFLQRLSSLDFEHTLGTFTQGSVNYFVPLFWLANNSIYDLRWWQLPHVSEVFIWGVVRTVFEIQLNNLTKKVEYSLAGTIRLQGNFFFFLLCECVDLHENIGQMCCGTTQLFLITR